MRHLRTKLTLLVAVLITLMTLLVGVIVAGLMLSSLRIAQQERAVTQASALAQLYSQQAQDVAQGEKPTPISSKVLTDLADTKVWYVGVPFYAGGEKVLSAPEDLQIQPEDVLRPQRVDWRENGTEMVGGAAPVQLDDAKLGTIIVAFPRSGLPLLKPLLASFVLAITMAWLIGIIAASWFSKKITRPLAALAEAARAVSIGSRDVVMPDYQGKDEVKELQDSFQRMLDDLELARQRDEHFFASVSHELRTPLTVMIGQLGMIRDKVSQPEDRLPEIERQAFKLQRLVEDLVDIAAMRQGRFDMVNERLRLIDWGPYVEDSWTNFLSERVELMTTWGPQDQPDLFVDPERLEQVFVNLVRNASRYANSLVRVEVTADAEGVEVLVQDDGEDIPRPNAGDGEEIFDAFVSDGMPGGLGMGLTISREIIRAMGGDLKWVPPSQRGPNALEGANFLISLPAAL